MTFEVLISDKDLQQIKESILKNHGLDLSYFKPAFLVFTVNQSLVQTPTIRFRGAEKCVKLLGLMVALAAIHFANMANNIAGLACLLFAR